VHKQSVYVLVLAVAALVMIGVVMLFSTGAYAPDSHGDEFGFLKKQSFWLGVGFFAAVTFAIVDYHLFQKIWMPMLGVAVLLLILCYIRPIGMRINGSWRWVHFGSLTFQPSEFAKLAAIAFTASWFSKFELNTKELIKGFIIPSAIISVILVLIIGETDLGSTILIGLTFLLLMFVAGSNLKLLGTMVLGGISIIGLLAWHIQERQSRILAFLNPEKYAQKEGHQQLMGLVAFGSGGIDGLGLGNGRQKMSYLPYAHTDFIFPVIGEELGLRITLLIVFCYLLVLTAGTMIALNAKDRFGMLLGFGCTAILSIQAMINIGVTTSLLPNKGLPLPFISYGGSNLFFCLLCIGILINIYRQGKEENPIGGRIVGTRMNARIKNYHSRI
jgi:cell division protein FtsW